MTGCGTHQHFLDMRSIGLALKVRVSTRTAAFALCLLAVTNGELHSAGLTIPHQTARGLALSNAYTAGVDDASAVYYNPAALGEIGADTLLVTAAYVGLFNSVENSGRDAVNKHDDNLMATLFANYRIPRSDITLGIGTYSPFGLATTYERDFTRFAAQRTELKTIYVTPAVSWRPTELFAVGAGVSYVHASGLFSRGLCLDPLTACTAPIGLEGRLRITDTTDAFAYNVGVLVKPTDEIKLGFSYRSRVDLRFDDGDVKLGGAFLPSTVKGDIRPLVLPPVINVGAFWRPTPEWGAELVYEYTRWSEFKNFAAAFRPTATFVPIGAPIRGFRLPQDWKNTSTLRFGAFYKVTQSWKVMGGFALEESAIPSRTLNPAIPDADKLTLNAGLGYKWSNFTVDVGYMAVFYKTRTVTNNELEGLPATAPLGFAGAPGRDKYSTFANFVSLSVGYRF
jgi:long-chain fatty acid transport protein